MTNSEQDESQGNQMQPLENHDAEVMDAEHYKGSRTCEFDGCSNEADFFIEMSDGGQAVPFLCCESCDRQYAIHAKANGHLGDDNA